MVAVSNAQEMLSTPINFINIVVKPNMMQGGSEYDFRIEAFDTQNKVKGFASRRGKINDGKVYIHYFHISMLCVWGWGQQ